ncbi:MAG: uroporphyrinogen decarboxylase family protein [Coprobacillus sp.]
MDDRERYHNSLNGGNVDRLNRLELGAWPSTIERWKKEGMPQNVSADEKLNEQFYQSANKLTNQKEHKEKEHKEKEISFNEFFEHDKLVRLPVQSGYCDSPFFPKFDDMILEDDGVHITLIDVDGVKKKIFKVNPDQSMPMFLEFPVKTPKDWEKIKTDRLDITRIKPMLGDISKMAKEVNEEERDFPVYMTACGGFGHPRNLLGDVNVCTAYYDYPDMMHDIMQNWYEVNREIVRLVSEYIQLDNYLIWEDMSYKNGPMISPKMVETFMLPYYDKLISYAKSRGVRAVSVDTDGDCRKLIPIFLEAGVDAIMPFEVQAGMNIVKIREEYGDVFTIYGGIDKRALSQDKCAIEKEVKRIIPYFNDSLRYMPCLDHTVPVDVSYDNYRYYLDCVRSFE